MYETTMQQTLGRLLSDMQRSLYNIQDDLDNARINEREFSRRTDRAMLLYLHSAYDAGVIEQVLLNKKGV